MRRRTDELDVIISNNIAALKTLPTWPAYEDESIYFSDSSSPSSSSSSPTSSTFSIPHYSPELQTAPSPCSSLASNERAYPSFPSSSYLDFPLLPSPAVDPLTTSSFALFALPPPEMEPDQPTHVPGWAATENWQTLWSLP